MMTNNNSKIEVDEIVGFLYDYFPNSISDLKAKFPQQSTKLLKKGIVMGGNENGLEYLDVKVQIAITGMESVIKYCDAIIPIIKKKVKKINLYQLITQIIVAVSSTTLIATLKDDNESIIFLKYFSSILALLGSISNIYIQYTLNQLNPVGNTLYKDYAYYIDGKVEAESILNEIKLLLKFQKK